MIIAKAQKQKIKKIGKKYSLKLILLHGSYATGKIKSGSDLDIAVLGRKLIEFKTLLKIHFDLAKILGDNRQRELDLKSLHNVNPLFRFEVMRDSILLFGKTFDYYSFKAYAFRNFQESQSLFELLGKMIEKKQKYLMEAYVK